ncbi:protein of unknown function [Thermanaeromonas toyohensis ToBE]|uniref:Transcobalamin-like C-terminal domain-containing protein n=1 Tax=Thermanaeromonas toyohensis ToBE TaxID=698762 RepID=A0A1W1VIL0_9FIRM|nr:DUF4430 domain-containing protein [Thermanaeromonas toyohensis]SMB93219.1 protein of unknown function [Thermanaeromonas toyohensis ToBE]
MKRRLFYLISMLILLAGAVGPALYMHKVFDSQQQYRQAESGEIIRYSTSEQSNASGQTRAAPTMGQPSSEANKDQPKQSTTEVKTVAPTLGQKTSTPNPPSKGNMVPPQTVSSASEVTSSENGCRVWIAVVGKDGVFLFKPAQVVIKKDNKWGITALGALDATGLPYATKPAWPDFVDSIAGQANSAMAGWMYSVNGEVPMHMASKHPVKTGDKVIWWYSKSMDQPPPRWEDLIQKE